MSELLSFFFCILSCTFLSYVYVFYSFWWFLILNMHFYSFIIEHHTAVPLLVLASIFNFCDSTRIFFLSLYPSILQFLPSLLSFFHSLLFFAPSLFSSLPLFLSYIPSLILLSFLHSLFHHTFSPSSSLSSPLFPSSFPLSLFLSVCTWL